MSSDRFPVEASHVMMFARAVGEDDQPYFKAMTDESGDLPIYAPPTFVQASRQFEQDYPLRPSPGVAWFGSGKEPSGVTAEELAGRGGSLHAEQHFTYHRPVRVGDVLTARRREGRTWTKTGRRGGNMKFSEDITDYHDQDGELVVTARRVGVLPEKTVENA